MWQLLFGFLLHTLLIRDFVSQANSIDDFTVGLEEELAIADDADLFPVGLPNQTCIVEDPTFGIESTDNNSGTNMSDTIESIPVDIQPKYIDIESGIKYPYDEKLYLRPLPKNFLLASFQFHMHSSDFPIDKNDKDVDQYTHYTVFPKTISPILDITKTRQLHLRFTHGLWDSESWGQLPHAGLKAGGTGVELWAVIEASDKDEAFHQWKKLANSLSGLFCASINFVDSSRTTYPVSSFQPDKEENGLPLFAEDNNLYLIRAALANEPICTENLTPFVKLLPTKGKSGISSLLDGHKVFDSPWHSLSIDVTTVCNDTTAMCYYSMEEYVETVINVPNTLARSGRPIPKPIDGSKLRCDQSKPYDEFQCFPLPEAASYNYEVSKIFGKQILGSNLISSFPTRVCANVTDNWKVFVKVEGDYFGTDDNCFDIKSGKPHDLYLEAGDATNVIPVEDVPIFVSRSLTGYGQDRGGLRTVFKNPTDVPVHLIYFESLPWFMRLYLSSLKIESNDPDLTIDDVINSTYYLPAIDRKRPTHIEYKITVPPRNSFALSYQFDKSLLKYAEYPPDANHGFDIESAVVTVVEPIKYKLRTATLLLSISTPDFSMPYNVIILTSTIMGLAFGTLFNLIVKRLVPVNEADLIAQNSGPKFVVRRLKNRLRNLIVRNSDNNKEKKVQ